MTYHMGIDPGRKGAIAVLDIAGCEVVAHDMPQTTAELHDLIADLPTIKLCVLEKLHPGPLMSRTAIARMFEDYGALKGALAWRDIPVKLVRPSIWKPAMGLTGDKSASRELAMQRFPAQSDLFKRAKDDGRAEAALLALYGVERCGQGRVRDA